MPAPGRLFANDEELGKKDDEYRPGTNGALSPAVLTSKWKVATPRMRKRRLFFALAAVTLIYLFIHNIPTDLTPVSDRVDIRVPGRTIRGDAIQGTYAQPGYGKDAPADPPPAQDDAHSPHELGKHYYNGQIKWYYLATTLQGAARTMGYRMFNKNVVFAAAGAQSIGRLLPLACEMARWQRNVVHLVLLGRDDLTIDEYKQINGVDNSCKIYWHDARPDYAPYSTDERFELNTYQSLIHIHNFLHPQLYIVDKPREEEVPFVRGFEGNVRKFGTTVIRLPTDAVQKLQWITRLDSGSLAAWHNTYVEILIHAPPESSGSLIRLLKSIESADYFGTRYPHLTIELPHELDKPTEEFLEHFIWPPLPEDGPHTSQLTLRRRIPHGSRLSATEASVRMIESFYPSRVKDSHVLLLSHQAQLSTVYYQYLMYNLLEYKYSIYGGGTRETEQLMGISLALPSRLLDDKTRLDPPAATYDETAREEYGDHIPFLWQAPDVHATLYFGDKWREFHSFLTNRLSRNVVALPKIVSATIPAFAEHMLEVMRVRNYFILYPNIPDYAVATIHDELYQVPEEFLSTRRKKGVESEAEASPPDTDEPFLTPESTELPPKNRERNLAYTALHQLLPADGDLPELSTLPVLGYTGKPIKPTAALKEAKSFTEDFRTSIGACPVGYEPLVEEHEAGDLFCYDPDKDYDAFVAEDTAGSRDGIVPVGFGGAKGREAVEELDVPVDEYGEPLEPEVSKETKDGMSKEFKKHLQRQSEQAKTKDGSSKKPSADSDKEAIFLDEPEDKEFKKHLLRQSKQAADASTDKDVSDENSKVILDDGETESKPTSKGASKEKPAAVQKEINPTSKEDEPAVPKDKVSYKPSKEKDDSNGDAGDELKKEKTSL